jgi:hypothetical protein
MIFIEKAYAQGVTPIAPCIIKAFCGKSQSDTPAFLGKLLSSIIGILLSIATIWAFIQLLIAGLQWISSGGDKSAMEGARQRILNALIGLLIVAVAWAFYIVILQFLGIAAEGNGGIFFTLPTIF